MIDGAILRGQNICIMAYGQTSSGKTYTMIGNEENPGLYFFVIEEIFKILIARPKFLSGAIINLKV